MNDLMQTGISITIVLVTINAFLLVGGALAGVQTENTFDFLPQGISFDSWDDTTIDKTDLELLTETTQDNSITTQLYNLVTSLPVIKELIVFGTLFISIITNALFYHLTVMQILGIPAPIIFIIAVPLTIIEVITLVAFMIQFVGAFKL